ncbi:F-box protein FBW2-like isoform X1 [Cucurbita pepo subsp. pepo]|uniref:F-box protein FBW2-like isoform X2 n=2 Tax=Cucurbita moschata TaxID=3662 RepID=A0A6J1FRM5_CUCMO|nr:F-box protein FBW2-like isoform X2 [Cucurbita moschata]XP_023524288.1 F-box protein FBW2-like isoform X1 [Cucurbita pepo subsp. pepo]XP_023524290.1 F-box protein FBW2-like isoform X1 [Cucurbita pepo subsp. pepo]
MNRRLEMTEGSDFRHWDELIPDALGLIFSKLPLQEILTVIPRVCKSWAKAVLGPYCWQEIDIEEWSSRCQPDNVDRMLQMLVNRSGGSLRKLCVTGLHNSNIFSFIADHAGSLQTLRLPRSNISDALVEQIAGRLSAVTFLDLSYCDKISASSLESIGKNCKALVGICRNLHPLHTAGMPLLDDEAYAIAATMPKLEHLEMAYHPLSTKSVMTILSSCPNLEFLDLRGCWDVRLEDKFVAEKFPKLRVLGPLVRDYYERNEWDECSDYSYISDDLAWDFSADYFDDDAESYDDPWDDEDRLEGLELRFYEGIDEVGGGFGWPPSP